VNNIRSRIVFSTFLAAISCAMAGFLITSLGFGERFVRVLAVLGALTILLIAVMIMTALVDIWKS